MSNKKLYKEAVVTFGHGPQTDVAVQAAASLICEIQKHKLMQSCNCQKAVAEMEIMCHQLRVIFPGVVEAKKEAVERLQGMIDVRRKGAQPF